MNAQSRPRSAQEVIAFLERKRALASSAAPNVNRFASAASGAAVEILDQAEAGQRDAAFAARVEEALPFGRSAAGRLMAELHLMRIDSSPVLLRAKARIHAERREFPAALNLIDQAIAAAFSQSRLEHLLPLLSDRVWLSWHEHDLALTTTSLESLNEYASRAQSVPHQLLFRLLKPASVKSAPAPLPDQERALHQLFSQAKPIDIWNIFPALGLWAKIYLRNREIKRRLFALIGDADSPFQRVSFQESKAQGALSALLECTGQPDLEYGRALNSIERLCDTWPYQVLFIKPPYSSESFSRDLVYA